MLETNKGASITVPKPSAGFHLYALEWSEDRLDFYVDDLKYFTHANDGTGTEAWPFDQTSYLMLNAAVGGGRGGAQGIDDAIFPQRFEIDFVRVFKPRR